MTVEFLPSDTGTVELRTIDALPNAPEWMLIQPDSEKKIRTLPSSHFFDGNSGQRGAGSEIVNTARQYIAGDIDQDAAEAAIATSITWWCNAS